MDTDMTKILMVKSMTDDVIRSAFSLDGRVSNNIQIVNMTSWYWGLNKETWVLAAAYSKEQVNLIGVPYLLKLKTASNGKPEIMVTRKTGTADDSGFAAILCQPMSELDKKEGVYVLSIFDLYREVK